MRSREHADRCGYVLKKAGAELIPDNIAFELDDLQALNDRIEVLAERC